MKKEYISPSLLVVKVKIESLLNKISGSVTSDAQAIELDDEEYDGTFGSRGFDYGDDY